MVCEQIFDFKCNYIKRENQGQWNAFSSADVLLSKQIKKRCRISKRYVSFIDMVPYLRVLFESGSLGSEVEIFIGQTENVPAGLQSIVALI